MNIEQKVQELLRKLRRVGYPAVIKCYKGDTLKMTKNVDVDPIIIGHDWYTDLVKTELRLVVEKRHALIQE